MAPSPSFAGLKKFQVMLVFASLTIVYLIYSLGSGYGGYLASSDGHTTYSISLPNPFDHDAKDTVETEAGSSTKIIFDTSPAPTPPATDVGLASNASEAINSTDSISHEDTSRPPPASVDTNEYVAFCIAHRNQRRDLPEFLRHHYHHHGIRRFYIMDDRSDPPLSSFNDYGIPRSVISFQYYDDQAQHDDMQTYIYAECARLYGKLHRWMAFIDADEFFETRSETLPEILRELDKDRKVGALGVNWRLHSSANLTTRPDSMRKSFTSCVEDPEVLPVEDLPAYKDNRLIKSIVKTSKFVRPLTPHLFITLNGTHTVGEHGDRIDYGDGIRQPITRDRIALHHYTTKSREQFEEKMQSWTLKGWEYWDHIEGLPQVDCTEMTKYSP